MSQRGDVRVNTSVRDVAREQTPLWAAAFGCAALLACAAPLLPLLVVRPLFQEVLIAGRFDRLTGLLVVAALLVVVGAVAQFGQDALFGLAAARVGRRLRALVFQAWLAAPLPVSQALSSGGRSARAALDVRELELFAMHEGGSSVSMLIALLVSTGLLLWMDPRLTVLLLIVVVPVVVVLNAVGRRVEVAFRAVQESAEAASGRMTEGLTRLEVIKAFGMQDRVLARFERDNAAQAAASARRAQLAALQAPVSQLAVGAALVLLLLLVGVEIRAGRLDAAGFTAYLTQLGIMVAPGQMLARNAGRFAAMREPLRTLNEALRLPAETTGGSVQAPARDGRVEVSELNATYSDGDAPALNGLSLSVQPGESVGVVGASGAGKTTLARVLLRLLEPSGGRLMLDGVSAQDYALGAWRASVAFVPQSPGLFAGTIFENLRLAKPDATPAEMRAALVAAGLGDSLAEWSDELEHMVGEDGRGLSGGQAQRLAIARAFITGAKVIVLDEPTSALDAETERVVRDSLARLRGRRTLIVIAHRLSTVRDLDRVVVMEAGRVVEDGAPAALELVGGRFAQLVRAGR